MLGLLLIDLLSFTIRRILLRLKALWFDPIQILDFPSTVLELQFARECDVYVAHVPEGQSKPVVDGGGDCLVLVSQNGRPTEQKRPKHGGGVQTPREQNLAVAIGA